MVYTLILPTIRHCARHQNVVAWKLHGFYSNVGQTSAHKAKTTRPHCIEHQMSRSHVSCLAMAQAPMPRTRRGRLRCTTCHPLGEARLCACCSTTVLVQTPRTRKEGHRC